jgi:hypothetical protein
VSRFSTKCLCFNVLWSSTVCYRDSVTFLL